MQTLQSASIDSDNVQVKCVVSEAQKELFIAEDPNAHEKSVHYSLLRTEIFKETQPSHLCIAPGFNKVLLETSFQPVKKLGFNLYGWNLNPGYEQDDSCSSEAHQISHITHLSRQSLDSEG